MVKLAQSIRSGEPLPVFVRREYVNYMNLLPEKNKRRMEKLKTLTDAYSAIYTSGIFLSITFLLATTLMLPGTSPMLILTAVLGLGFTMALISLLMYNTARPESVPLEGKFRNKRQALARTFALASVAAALALEVLSYQFFPEFTLAIGGLPLLLAGAIGKIYIRSVKKKEEEYLFFLRNFLSVLESNVPLLTALENALLVKYGGGLEKLLKRLYARLAFRIDRRIAWKSFEVETGSKLIHKINDIILDIAYRGGNIYEASKVIEETYTTYIELRKRRYQIVSYFKGLIIPLHLAMCLLMGVVNAFFDLLLYYLQMISQAIQLVYIPAVDVLNLFFLSTILIFSFTNTIALYFTEGDSRYTLLFYLGFFTFIGRLVFLGSRLLTSSYLSSIKF